MSEAMRAYDATVSNVPELDWPLFESLAHISEPADSQSDAQTLQARVLNLESKLSKQAVVPEVQSLDTRALQARVLDLESRLSKQPVASEVQPPPVELANVVTVLAAMQAQLSELSSRPVVDAHASDVVQPTPPPAGLPAASVGQPADTQEADDRCRPRRARRFYGEVRARPRPGRWRMLTRRVGVASHAVFFLTVVAWASLRPTTRQAARQQCVQRCCPDGSVDRHVIRHVRPIVARAHSPPAQFCGCGSHAPDAGGVPVSNDLHVN